MRKRIYPIREVILKDGKQYRWAFEAARGTYAVMTRRRAWSVFTDDSGIRRAKRATACETNFVRDTSSSKPNIYKTVRL